MREKIIIENHINSSNFGILVISEYYYKTVGALTYFKIDEDLKVVEWEDADLEHEAYLEIAASLIKKANGICNERGVTLMFY